MNYFSKLTSVIAASIVLGLGFAGCAGESEAEGESVASATAIISTEPIAIESIAETTVEPIPETTEVSPDGDRTDRYGVYTYKGFEFEGWFSESDFGTFFYADAEALNQGVGKDMLDVAYDATMAFIAVDYDKLLIYFDDEEDKRKQIEEMKSWDIKAASERFFELAFHGVYFYTRVNDDPDYYPYFRVNYVGAFDNSASYLEEHGNLGEYDIYDLATFQLITLSMDINEDGKWSLAKIEYNIG